MRRDRNCNSWRMRHATRDLPQRRHPAYNRGHGNAAHHKTCLAESGSIEYWEKALASYFRQEYQFPFFTPNFVYHSSICSTDMDLAFSYVSTLYAKSSASPDGDGVGSFLLSVQQHT